VGLHRAAGVRGPLDHPRLYFYFSASKELWSCRVEGTNLRFKQGYATTISNSYA
jgi:hypothetical protein